MNCGITPGYTASSCSHCVYDGSGRHADASWCSSDDCQWRHGECVEAGATDCGDHNAPSCSRCPYGKEGYHQARNWCGGECRWNDNKECVSEATTMTTATNATNPSGYYLVTSGSACERITSKEECEEAARQLGLSDTNAAGENVSDWPPYCYSIDGRSLYFNNNGYSTSRCSAERLCICKEVSGKAGSQICNKTVNQIR